MQRMHHICAAHTTKVVSMSSTKVVTTRPGKLSRHIDFTAIRRGACLYDGSRGTEREEADQRPAKSGRACARG
ncbi:hypothetical protein CBM2634_U310003 [Cupriavidus taiwanensis]|uniref:Uncharacterized protein n=1 Tax=Cupriavidus taiwanensis TaxID=164546 RepID=A0A375JC85_9BURK|nr:hypothetical protein CBM2634_U310003 [Cupriavidus taiwanensis]